MRIFSRPAENPANTASMLENILDMGSALEEQRNREWRYLEFLQVTSLITADAI